MSQFYFVKPILYQLQNKNIFYPSVRYVIKIYKMMSVNLSLNVHTMTIKTKFKINPLAY